MAQMLASRTRTVGRGSTPSARALSMASRHDCSALRLSPRLHSIDAKSSSTWGRSASSGRRASRAEASQRTPSSLSSCDVQNGHSEIGISAAFGGS